jgi:photosystem II stability/assembly factor-like uncharacterized protein
MNTIFKNLGVESFAELSIRKKKIYFVGTFNGVFRSTDSGINWKSSNAGLTNTRIRSFAVSGTIIYAGTYGGGVFRSTDGGKSWNSFNNHLMNSNVWGFCVIDSRIFVGTAGGIFFCTNNSRNWIDVNSGLKNITVLSLAVMDSILFAGTDRNGIWRRPLREMTLHSIKSH